MMVFTKLSSRFSIDCALRGFAPWLWLEDCTDASLLCACARFARAHCFSLKMAVCLSVSLRSYFLVIDIRMFKRSYERQLVALIKSALQGSRGAAPCPNSVYHSKTNIC